MGIRRNLRKARVKFRLFQARWLNFLFGVEEVTLLVRRIEKESIPGILRNFGARIGQDCDIESGLIIHQARSNFANLEIQDNCHIGKEVFLDLRQSIIIHANSTVSMRSMILTHFDKGKAELPGEKYANFDKGVAIGPSAYLGASVIVLPGVTIGSHSLIGAGSLVNKEVPPRTIGAGVPLREIRNNGAT